jgi:predicted TIM-barrel fold metal-dependent hydrolase
VCPADFSDSTADSPLWQTVHRLPLLDQHCHGVIRHDPSAAQIEALINEGGLPAAPGTTRWDSPVGLALRRHCAPALDLDPFASPDAYLARRHALGADEVNRRLLRTAGTAGLLLDTGFRSEEIAGPAAMSELAGVPTWEIVRLEAVAEEVIQSGVGAEQYPAAFAESLADRLAHAVGLKSVLAYRGGFAIEPGAPAPSAVVAAAARWLREIEAGHAGGQAAGRPARLTDPTLLRFGIWTGARLGRERGRELGHEHGLPLQFHVGYGDPDLTLHLTNPSLLTGLLRGLGDLGVPVVLLHCYPYHREAAYLADMFPHVYVDLGLALTFSGASAGRIVAETMEVAPFTKQVYSSDGFGLAELHYLGACHFRAGLARVLGGWIEDGACTLPDAERIASLIASENARRIYPLRHWTG